MEYIVALTLLFFPNGDVKRAPDKLHTSMEECLAWAHQKSFLFPPDGAIGSSTICVIQKGA